LGSQYLVTLIMLLVRDSIEIGVFHSGCPNFVSAVSGDEGQHEERGCVPKNYEVGFANIQWVIEKKRYLRMSQLRKAKAWIAENS
jgi:hypothetical protein